MRRSLLLLFLVLAGASCGRGTTAPTCKAEYADPPMDTTWADSAHTKVVKITPRNACVLW